MTPITTTEWEAYQRTQAELEAERQVTAAQQEQIRYLHGKFEELGKILGWVGGVESADDAADFVNRVYALNSDIDWRALLWPGDDEPDSDELRVEARS